MTNQQTQCLLYYLGYYKGRIDGKLGNESKRSIKAFQKDYGLTVDGIVGEKTIKALKQAITYGIPTGRGAQYYRPPYKISITLK